MLDYGKESKFALSDTDRIPYTSGALECLYRGLGEYAGQQTFVQKVQTSKCQADDDEMFKIHSPAYDVFAYLPDI